MWLKAGISFGVLLAFASGLWWVKSRLDLLQTTQARLATVEQMLNQSRNEVAALQMAAKMDNQDNIDGYEKADWACQETVKRAVAGTRVVKVPTEEIVYVDREISTPQDCPIVKLPDFFRLRDIQAAGTNPD
jgi:hypothetical protein